jgi:hypothetical protein
VGCWHTCFSCSLPQIKSICTAFFDQNIQIQNNLTASCKVRSAFVLKKSTCNTTNTKPWLLQSYLVILIKNTLILMNFCSNTIHIFLPPNTIKNDCALYQYTFNCVCCFSTGYNSECHTVQHRYLYSEALCFHVSFLLNFQAVTFFRILTAASTVHKLA